MRRILPVALALSLSACAGATNLAIAPAVTEGQQVYRAAGVVEAAAWWVSVYVVQTQADPIAAASLVDAVRVADDAAIRAEGDLVAGRDPSPRLRVVGQAVTGLVLVAEAKQLCGGPVVASPSMVSVAQTLIEDATARMMRLGAASGRLEGLRQRLAAMDGRDPTPAEMQTQEAATAAAVKAMLAAAHVKE